MTILEKDPVKLRSFSEEDQVRVAELCNNIKIWNNVRDFFPNPYSEEDAATFIRSCREEDPQVTFAIDFKGELAGCAGLVRQTDIYKLSAEIGYWIGEPFWGMGIATTAVELLSEYGLNDLGLIRIYSAVFDFNKASQRVLEKSGYQLEGIFKKSIIKNGLICDEFRYARVKNIPAGQ